jgi:hypothetical protein
VVFGPEKGRGGNIGKSNEQLVEDLLAIHNAENWLAQEHFVTDMLPIPGGSVTKLFSPLSWQISWSVRPHSDKPFLRSSFFGQ